jgi:hypothetical protein
VWRTRGQGVAPPALAFTRRGASDEAGWPVGLASRDRGEGTNGREPATTFAVSGAPGIAAPGPGLAGIVSRDVVPIPGGDGRGSRGQSSAHRREGVRDRAA